MGKLGPLFPPTSSAPVLLTPPLYIGTATPSINLTTGGTYPFTIHTNKPVNYVAAVSAIAFAPLSAGISFGAGALLNLNLSNFSALSILGFSVTANDTITRLNADNTSAQWNIYNGFNSEFIDTTGANFSVPTSFTIQGIMGFIKVPSGLFTYQDTLNCVTNSTGTIFKAEVDIYGIATY